MVENQTRKVKAIPLRRLKMSRRTEPLAAPQNFGVARCRTLKPEESVMIGNLLARCFQGSIDDEGQPPQWWRQLARQTFSRGIDEDSSLVLFDEKTPICAMVVVGRGQSYSLDLAMTHPEYRGLGLAELLIRQCLHNLHQKGIARLSLLVTEDNAPAMRLYNKLGFKTQEDFYYLKVVIT
ncbi:MAG: GNAT family N-acetyltransferase [Cyanobacteria bacterium SZAS-4]|nr:GNAT family N-acetyltransferase [Cyanobacteria bacterium SZAS-4]